VVRAEEVRVDLLTQIQELLELMRLVVEEVEVLHMYLHHLKVREVTVVLES
jgi:hypothetical protein